jgi:hypothetical protein
MRDIGSGESIIIVFTLALRFRLISWENATLAVGTMTRLPARHDASAGWAGRAHGRAVAAP